MTGMPNAGGTAGAAPPQQGQPMQFGNNIFGGGMPPQLASNPIMQRMQGAMMQSPMMQKLQQFLQGLGRPPMGGGGAAPMPTTPMAPPTPGVGPR